MAIAIEFNGTDLTIGSNGFSTLNRYIRQVANSADGVMWMVEGPSLAINYKAQSVSDRVNWRFECGALTYESVEYLFTPGDTNVANGFATSRLIAV